MARDIPFRRPDIDHYPASLDLRFALNKVLPPGGFAVTYTGADNGTFFSSTGVLTTSGSDAARFDHTFNGTTWISRGLLIEEARTNLCLQSEDFDTTWATGGDAAVTTNAIAAPDGNTTADRITATGNGGANRVSQGITSNTQVTFSAFVKIDDATHMNIRLIENGGVDAFQDFQFSSGTFVTSDADVDAEHVQDVEDGWFRIGITVTATNAGSWSARIGAEISAASTGTKFYVWGAQLEAGAFPTSYIAATTAAVTRTADVATMSDVTWHNTTAGTYYVEGDVIAVNQATLQTLLQIDDGGTTDRIRMYQVASSNDVAFQTVNSGGNNGFLQRGGNTVVAGTAFKYGAAYANDDIADSFDGGAISTDSTADHPLTDAVTTFQLGIDHNSVAPINGHIARIMYWPVRLPNGILQSITR